MAGSLIKLEEVTLSTATSSVLLGDDKWDTSYDVYQVIISDCHTSADNLSLYARFLVSGSPDTSSNYDYSQKTLRTLEVFGNEAQVNQDKLNFGSIGNAAGEFYMGSFYLFNFNNASEYSFGTKENLYGGVSTRGWRSDEETMHTRKFKSGIQIRIVYQKGHSNLRRMGRKQTATTSPN